MNAFELLDELLEKSEEEVDFALLSLLLKKKIDFVKLSTLYTKSLEEINEDKLNQLIEAETCVSMCFHSKLGGKKPLDQRLTQRCLYLLNKSRRFNMGRLNEKFAYNESEGRDASWYELNKRHLI